MSTLTSASTDAQVQAAYDDNASYVEDASATKCGAFITACRFLLRRMAKSGSAREYSFSTSPELIRAELTAAQTWLATNSTASGGGYKGFSTEYYRG